jgi:hypothetical protein
MEALAAGRTRFDFSTPFLVKQILSTETPTLVPTPFLTHASVQSADPAQGGNR